VDIAGTARSGGGLCMTARDLARVGEPVRQHGRVDGRQLIPANWMTDMLSGGSVEAWRQCNFSGWLPEGKVPQQVVSSRQCPRRRFAVGIHGQWLYVDTSRETVIAKFSSQPLPTDDDAKHLNLALFEAIAAMA